MLARRPCVLTAGVAAVAAVAMLATIVCANDAPPVPPSLPSGYALKGGPASGFIRDLVLTYMDSRSLTINGTAPTDPTMVWTVDKYKSLVAWRDTTGVPRDLFFDGFLLIGIQWTNGRNFWPGVGRTPTNATDWLGFLDLQMSMGVQNLNTAVGEVYSELQIDSFSPAPPTTPGVVLMIPYPDARQQDFGSVTGPGGRSLNFSSPSTGAADRLAACTWFVDQARARFAAQFNSTNPQRVRLTGWYWFYESAPTASGDPVMLPKLSSYIHAAPSTVTPVTDALTSAPTTSTSGEQFFWVPYFASANPTQWRSLGFDSAQLQPNFAFRNVTAANRFPAVANITSSSGLGIEMELPMGIRNHLVPNCSWQISFETYLNYSVHYGWDKAAQKSYYYGNAFVNMTTQPETRGYYDKLYYFVRGTYPHAPPLPGGYSSVLPDGRGFTNAPGAEPPTVPFTGTPPQQWWNE